MDDSYCPHCGARGKYIYEFITEDGKRGGAMSGCIKLFPQSRFFADSMRIAKKERDYAKKGWNIPSWDREIKQAINDFIKGGISKDDAMVVVSRQRARAANYRRNRRGY